MKLRFNRLEMAEALRAITAVAALRTPKPVLRCARVEAKGDVLLLSATDLEVALRCAITQVEVDTPGDTLVLAETLSRIVSECPDEILVLDTDGTQMQVRGQGSHFRIPTTDPADFPPVGGMEGAPHFTVAMDVLRRQIEWTVFASARESTRYAINGVLWELTGDKLTLAATDGRRLSVAHSKVTREAKGGEVPPAIVPTKALSLLMRLPVAADSPVGVKVSANQVVLSVGGSLVSSSLVEGHFPKYQDVVPTDCNRILEIATADYLGALKRASLMVNEESKGVRLSLSEGNLTLSTRAPEQGEATVSVPARYRGEPMDIGFNPMFLMDALRVVHTDEVSFAVKDANRPGIMRVGDDFTYVIMPVSLASA